MESTLSDGIADLHTHTTASDGTIGVGERVGLAREQGLDAIAITDHDVVSEEFTERYGRSEGVEVVTGVEIRGDLFDTKIELLGYYVDPTDDGLQSLLSRVRTYRRKRNAQILDEVSRETGLDVSPEMLRDDDDAILGRPHIAEYLVEQGVVSSIGAAFDEFLGSDGSCFVPMERVSHDEVVSTIQEAGGVASLAHPGRIREPVSRVEEMVKELSEAGLDGIETWYPYGDVRSDEYAGLTVDDAFALADEHDLLKTGGSDCHGPRSNKFRLGNVKVPASAFEAIRERAGEYRILK
ncbi:PHP domain-containing protein [Halorussus salinisoli]|uniref:PHP domain-containing protein n=1 Tax=Halorussus salinisoli TaxID=2558242 RepID=UPI0010C1EACF|nr:PHP domain-containing protein [Halorussus salinisoli]